MQPFTLLIKPSGSDCNIDCKYCFYKDRPSEFGHGKQRMSAEVLETLVKDYMDLDFPVAGFVVIEHTGDAFCCEFFVEPKWRLGNILETPLEKLAGDSKKRAFARDKEKLCNKCLLCRHLDICRGGCMKDRARWNEQGGERESYFCESYRQFFDNTVPRFMQIAAGIENGSFGRHTRSADKIRLHIEKLQRKQRFKIKSLA